MPKAERMRLAGSPSLTARMRGMPPATAASKASATRLRRASSNSSAPWWARRALFAVTTCLPACSALRMKVRAGSSPPTSSMTICTAGSSSTVLASATIGRRLRSSPSRGRARSASATLWSTSRQPARSSISAAWLCSTLITPLPTVPRPRSAILISVMGRPEVAARAAGAGAQPRRARRLRLARGETLQAPQGLLDALLVLDQGEAHVALAVLPEADAGGDCHLALLDEHLGELERAHGAEGVGNRRPDEHRALGFRHGPAELVEAVHQHVAPLLMQPDDLAHAGLVAFERDDGGNLDGLEGAVVEVGLDARQGIYHAGIAAHEAHPPAGHVVRLRQRENLHPDILGPGRRKE